MIYTKVMKYPNRHDIKNNLPHGAMKSIASQLGSSRGHVSKVLAGRSNPNTPLNSDIIDLAQAMASLHIWNERFNKGEKTLNPLTPKIWI